MKTAIFLWVVIAGSTEDHWHRFPMPSMQACERAIATSKNSFPAAQKNANSLIMFCAGEKEVQYTDRSYGK